uniref:Gypsy retrotransposon integrase-like protein 1 n=1 Tax=Leptobrachium leishanense TaxID=445787 RepID=A0A8C5Q0K8_9ANUR
MQQIRAHAASHPQTQGSPSSLDQQCLFVPQKDRLTVLQTFHDLPSSGNPVERKTKELITRYFQWPYLSRDVKRYVASCLVCARMKVSHTKPTGLLQPLPVPERPRSHVTVDFIVDLPPSQGFSTIMVTVDRLTKMIPEAIMSDRGVQFTSRFWKHFCQALGIQVDLSTAHHPHTNGQTERVNQSLETYLCCYTTFLQDDWADLLGTAEFSYNARLHDSTHYSLFFLLYGYHPSPLPDLPSGTPVPSVTDWLQSLERCRFVARDSLLAAQATYKAYADRHHSASPVYHVGQRVWLSTRFLHLSCPTRKLGPHFNGPFLVTALVGLVAVRLLLPRRYRLHPVVHLSFLKPVCPNPFPGHSLPPPPVLVAGSPEFFWTLVGIGVSFSILLSGGVTALRTAPGNLLMGSMPPLESASTTSLIQGAPVLCVSGGPAFRGFCQGRCGPLAPGAAASPGSRRFRPGPGKAVCAGVWQYHADQGLTSWFSGVPGGSGASSSMGDVAAAKQQPPQQRKALGLV